VSDPVSQVLVRLVVDHRRVRCVSLTLLRREDTAFDPVVDHPQADTVPPADLLNAEGMMGRLWAGDAVLVADPLNHSDGQRPTARASVTLRGQHGDDALVVMTGRQFPDSGHERLGIAHGLGAVQWQGNVQCFGRAALPANVQPNDLLAVRVLRYGDIMDQQAQDALAVARSSARRRP
jgi:hypothetical protein